MHLNAHSYYSLRYGTLSVEELLELAQEKGHTAIALTDINCATGALEFVQKAREKGIRPVVGIEFRTDNRLDYIGIARNESGFRQLNGFLTHHLRKAALGEKGIPEGPGSLLPTSLRTLRFPPQAPDLPDTFFIYPLARAPHPGGLRGNEFVGIAPLELNRLFTSPFRDRHDRLVCLLPVTFKDKVGYNTHRLLRAIDRNILLSKQDPGDIAAKDEVMLGMADFLNLYRGHAPIVTNTIRLMEACSFSMSLGKSKNRKHFTSSEEEDFALLSKLSRDGFERRYGKGDHEAWGRMEKELGVIKSLSFCSYFLITWDVLNYTRGRGFHHVGRGSGANSIVAYVLGITDVDPIRLNLYFERFLNSHRASPPDFDIDFSWTDRDDVLDYLFKRYGEAHTAFVCTVVRFQGRSIIRELGKVFGLPDSEIDALVATRNAPPATDDQVYRSIRRYAPELEGLPSHLGVHPGGVLITEEPISSFSSVFIPPKGFPVLQMDMFTAEDAGLHKLDILSQRGLGHIRSSAELVRSNKGIGVDVRDVEAFMADPEVAALIREGRTVGAFYVESPAMRQLLRKLKCDDYPTLVAASSVIRPGVAKSGMMDAYIRRHLATRGGNADPGGWYLHPSMGEYLSETYGVMVYQEDVIKVGHLFGGLDLGEADVLRRGMSGKYRSLEEFQSIRDRFFANCAERGIAGATATEVWRQMESFAGYSFCKAHSASFAVESYQSLHFKAHHPLEFMVAVINNFGGYYRTEIYVHEARRCGGRIHAPCVNSSEYLTSIRGNDIRLGFVHMKGLQQTAAKAIVEGRKHGPYTGLADLAGRVPMLGLEQTQLLVRIGGLRFTGKPKKTLLWEAALHFSKPRVAAQHEALFNSEGKDWQIPQFPDDPIEDAYDEMELLGFPLCSPFEFTGERPGQGEVCAAGLKERVGQRVSIRGYLVSTKALRTSKGQRMAFADFIDPEGEMFDTVLFPGILSQSTESVLQGTGVYSLKGRVVQQFGVEVLEVDSIRKVPYLPDPRYVDVG